MAFSSLQSSQAESKPLSEFQSERSLGIFYSMKTFMSFCLLALSPENVYSKPPCCLVYVYKYMLNKTFITHIVIYSDIVYGQEFINNIVAD